MLLLFARSCRFVYSYRRVSVGVGRFRVGYDQSDFRRTTGWSRSLRDRNTAGLLVSGRAQSLVVGAVRAWDELQSASARWLPYESLIVG